VKTQIQNKRYFLDKSALCTLDSGGRGSPYILEKLERKHMVRKPIGTRATTGERCPESGVWRVEGNLLIALLEAGPGKVVSTTAPIAEGNVMPPYNNRSVMWQLVEYA
jgi:hypothetical protein